MRILDIRENLDPENQLLKEAQRISGQPTKTQTVAEAHPLMIRLRQQGGRPISFWQTPLARQSRPEPKKNAD